MTWDDHEVYNDYANTQTYDDPDYADVRAAAYQSWYEHQPVRIGWDTTIDAPTDLPKLQLGPTRRAQCRRRPPVSRRPALRLG